MKRLLFILALCQGFFLSWGQKRDFFRLPAEARPTDYSRSYVLVKVKTDHMSLFGNSSQGGRVANPLPSSTGASSVQRLVSNELIMQGRALRGPRMRASNIDMSRYMKVFCPAGTDMEQFINNLYATGHFDVVEPDYVNRMFFTPNDPDVSKQYYLANIKAFEGWDLATGSENIVIAIVDSGGDMDHPDLVNNYWSNPNDPNDGLNNDGDAYFNDYQGWDFMGADTLNINDPNFVGDNNVNITNSDNAHGVAVAGCASGRVNNGIGIAGVGFNAKLMITKHTADNQDAANPGIYRAYEGIIYAASKGAHVINTSWGGTFKSEIAQDIVNYANDLGSLIVAGAGNANNAVLEYPASYDNVVSVGGTDKDNVKASFSSFNKLIDISAPAVKIHTTFFNNTYTDIDGTSFSGPIVAGAAALVWGKNPTFGPQQVAEQLRISADANALYSVNSKYAGRLGYGLLDVKNALTLSSPAIRASSPKMLLADGTAAVPGQPAFLTFNFSNLLKSTSAGLQISISTTSAYMTISKSSITPGIIADNSSITNTLTPFEVALKANVPENTQIDLVIKYKDGAYNDSQTVTFLLNPSFIDVNQNLITTTVSGIGRIGYEDPQASTRTKGSGFVFNQNSILYEMGLIMGTASTNLYNNVRGAGTSFDQDFVSTTKIKQILPGTQSTSEVSGSFSNSKTIGSQAVTIDYRSLVWKEVPYDKFVIMEYKIGNPTATDITNFYFGIFADWDITTNGREDAADWDAAHNFGYVFPKTSAAKPYGGIQVLTGSPLYYAIDNDQTIAGNPFGLYDGFTDTEKFKSISGIPQQRFQAGQTKTDGNDVSHVVSAGPLTIPAGQQVTIAFALHAAANLDDMVTSSLYADSVYNYTLKAPKPLINNDSVCFDTPVTLNATGATKLNWYKTFTGGTSFFTGSQLVTGNLTNDTTFYVSNAEHTYESVRSASKVKVKANPTILTSGSTTFCNGESITLSVAEADTYSWSTGETTRSITVNTADTYSVTVTSTTPVCSTASNPVITLVNPKPQSVFSIGTTGTLSTGSPVSFVNESIDGDAYFWEFGDNQSSTDPNPTHTYTSGSDFTITLTTTAANGCQDISQQGISVITGIDEVAVTGTQAYPNPFKTGINVYVDANDPVTAVRITDGLGRTIYQNETVQHSSFTIAAAAGLPDGLYILSLKYANRSVSQKIIKGE